MIGPRAAAQAPALGLAAALLALACLAGGCAVSAGAAPVAAPSSVPSAEPLPGVAGEAATDPAPPPAVSGQPTKPAEDRGPQPIPKDTTTVRSVRIDAVDIATSGLERLHLLEDGSLAAPEDPDRAGWFVDGTVPGELGPAVVAGHVDSRTGPAVFYDLRRVRPGAVVVIGLSRGRSAAVHHVRFRVDRVVTTAKRGFPTDEVFGPTPDAQLRLITCGGPYDRERGYLDNTVVFATRI